MGRGIGQALLALGGGLSGWGGDLATERGKRADREAELALRGYYPAAPEAPALPEAPEPGPAPRTDPMLDAVEAGGGGRTLMPGMRPQPLSATMGMDTDFGDVGPEDPRAYTPAPPRASPAEVAEAVRGVRAPRVPLYGQEYEYHPERTPEGQRQALQDALRQRQQRAAYSAWRQANPGRTEPFEATDDWQAVMAQTLARAAPSSGVDPTLNRQHYDALPASVRQTTPYVEGHDYKNLYDAYARGEIGQTNRTEFRVMFPPNTGGGAGGLTPAQEHSRALEGARGKAQQLASQRVPAQAILEWLNYNYGELGSDVLGGIATSAVQTYAPKEGRGGRRLTGGSINFGN